MLQAEIEGDKHKMGKRYLWACRCSLDNVFKRFETSYSRTPIPLLVASGYISHCGSFSFFTRIYSIYCVGIPAGFFFNYISHLLLKCTWRSAHAYRKEYIFYMSLGAHKFNAKVHIFGHSK